MLSTVKPVDLRSDFLSRPTPQMMSAMADAAIGKAAFGLREDPWQKRLETDAAALLGKEDALFVPTCTMANQIALMIWARPGDSVVADAQSHLLVSEAGAHGAIAGLVSRGLSSEFGAPDSAQWEAASSPPSDAQMGRVTIFALENTHNRGAGNALPARYVAEIGAIAEKVGARLHLDGSRLFNASVALGEKPECLAAAADSVSVSLNKGLCAPNGAILAGSQAFIEEAVRVRQMLGGGFRPTSMLAAAAVIAIGDWSHLAEDHRRAAKLRDGLGNHDGLHVQSPPNPTNIVVLRLERSLGAPRRLCRMLERHGVLALPFGADQVRLVTYRDIDDLAIDRAVTGIQEAVRALKSAGQWFEERD